MELKGRSLISLYKVKFKNDSKTTDSNENKEESEFGSGFIVNLMKFFEHFSNSQMQRIWHVESWLKNKEIDLSKCDINQRRDVESFQRIELAVRGTDKKAFASMVETWANGATDHLYDLHVPKQWEKTELAKNVTELRNFGLRMGHGFTEENYTYDDIEKLRNLCQKIAVEADILIGIKKGDWGRY